MTDATLEAREGETRASKLLFEGADWSFPLLQTVYEAVQKVALEDLGLNVFPNQIEVISAEQIQKRVGEIFGLRAQDLNVRSNSRQIVLPRQVAMFVVKQLTSASLPEIGRQFGGKHHTTVLHSINKIESERQTNKDLNKKINRLLDSFG